MSIRLPLVYHPSYNKEIDENYDTPYGGYLVSLTIRGANLFAEGLSP